MFFKGKIPFVRLLLALLPGIILAKVFHFSLLITTVLVLVGAGLTILTVIFYRILNLYKFQWIPGITIHLLMSFLGLHLSIINDPRNSGQHFADLEKDALIISVINEPRLLNGTVRFEGQVKYVLFKNERKSASGYLLVAFKVDSVKNPPIVYGDLLLIPSNINAIQGPLNPGEFDYRKFLANKQVYHQIFTQPEYVHKLQSETGNSLISFALKLRKQAVGYFNRYILNPDAAAIASTLILGYRADLSTDIIEAYSKTGTMHVLSVSGMHVGLVFLVLNQLLKKLDRGKGFRYLKPTLIILLIWFYALITGFSPSVCRAAMMLSFYVLGKALNRSQNSYNLIAISAFLLLIYNPYFLFDVGFQLSYLAVLGLVYFHPKIYHLFHIKSRFIDQIWNYSALSVAAQLATFSLSIYYFHQFPVYFLISNLFIVLPVTLIMYLGFVFLLVPVPLISVYLGKVLNFLIQLVNSGLYEIENAPSSTINDLWLSNLQLFTLTLGVLLIFVAFQFRYKLALYGSLASLFVFALTIPLNTLIRSHRHELIFYSLKRNTGIGIIRGAKATLISDVDDEKIFSYSIRPSLSSKGITNLVQYKPGIKIDGYSHKNFHQFSGYRILNYDRSFNNKRFLHVPVVDAVLLSGNAAISLKKLQKMVRFKILIIDGNNPDYKVREWEAEAHSLKISYYTLKNNAAYVIPL